MVGIRGPGNPSWSDVRAFLENRIKELHNELEHTRDSVDHAERRGEIRGLRNLAAAADPSRPLDV